MPLSPQAGTALGFRAPLTLSRSPAVRRISHGGAIFHIARQYFTRSKNGFHRARKCAYWRRILSPPHRRSLAPPEKIQSFRAFSALGGAKTCIEVETILIVLYKKAPLYGELANEVRLSGCERHKRNFTACVSMLYPIYSSISFSVPITPFMCVRS